MSSYQRLGDAQLLYVEPIGAWPDQVGAGEYWPPTPTPVIALFERAYTGDRDDDTTWHCIHELQLRHTPEVFDSAMDYCQSRDPRWREIGLDVLAQLGADRPSEQRWYRPECRTTALRGLNDPNIHVVRSAAMALAHLNADCSTTDALLGLEGHPDAEVRVAVTAGLVGQNTVESRQALLRLMEDENQDVREWATTAIGQSAEPSPEVVRALQKRWNEETFEDARNQALWGLARFRDRAAIEELVERFRTATWVSGDMAAIRELHGYQDDDPPIWEIIEATRYYLYSNPGPPSR
ncbi:HEAT repeat domain-containing protein [uncultured Paludibaculum sp.]|uniref:HEAT repeat domain-containing protein n=1 Tax=uncultured Paludibaculum sp. TaxID=1765020 RepID=UPI002AAB9D36|nr:HEAT repeat domain-containing protein [uncultured Paludibaculum sp.]